MFRPRARSKENATDNPSVAINGRWLSKSVTGTQRYALEVSRLLLDDHTFDATLYVPRGTCIPSWASHWRIVELPTNGIMFDQLVLPLMTARSTLLNLSGSATVWRRRQVAVLFDASTYRFPSNFSWRFRLWYRLMFWLTSRRARSLVTISDFCVSELSDVLRLPPERFHIAACGSEHLRAVEPAAPPFSVPESFVLCVGTLAKRKNLLPVVEALSAADITCVVVGAAGTNRIYADAATSFGSDRVIVAGRLSDAEIAWLMQRARCLVFPSFYEGFGLPIVEAQAFGCPVVAANSSSLPEVGRESVLYFNPGDPAEALAKVVDLLNSPPLRDRLIEAGRANAERFQWSSAASIVRGAVAESASSR